LYQKYFNLLYRGYSSTQKQIAKFRIIYGEEFIKGGPEPLEKDIHGILGSKCEDRFSDPFFDWVQNTSLVRFFVPASLVQFL